jgi:hypothetical protein
MQRGKRKRATTEGDDSEGGDDQDAIMIQNPDGCDVKGYINTDDCHSSDEGEEGEGVSSDGDHDDDDDDDEEEEEEEEEECSEH